MNVPGFAAEASLYAPWRHYSDVVASPRGLSESILPQSLFCARLGKTCGGIDLVCCPGLRCTAGRGGLGVCVPDLFHCSPCVNGRQICCPPPGLGLRCSFRPCM